MLRAHSCHIEEHCSLLQVNAELLHALAMLERVVPAPHGGELFEPLTWHLVMQPVPRTRVQFGIDTARLGTYSS